jgi:phosphate starvation-inducible PhoH-like protein
MDEKFDPYLEPVIDILNERLGKTLVKYYQKQDRIVGKPLAYLRGKTLKNSMVIVDEAQNLTKAQMLMVLTRIGEGCKLIIDGDMAQSDIKDSGLPDAIARLEGQLNDCRIVRFTNADVVRSGIVADILALYDK